MADQKTAGETLQKLQLWRVIGIFAMIFVAVQLSVAFLGVGINFLMRQVNAGENLRVFLGGTLSRAGMIAAAILFCAPVIRRVFGKDDRALLYPIKKGAGKDLLAGFGFSALAMAFLFLFELAMGWLRVEGLAFSGIALDAVLRAFWLALWVNLAAAMGEEVLFRGLLLTGLREAWDAPGALFVSAVIFGASHILVAGARQTDTIIFIPLLALPGILLGWTFLRTGNLWLATVIHFGWNFFQDSVFNLASRTNADTLIGFSTKQTGPAWFVGTEFGIEVGLGGVLCLLIVAFLIGIYSQKEVEIRKGLK